MDDRDDGDLGRLGWTLTTLGGASLGAGLGIINPGTKDAILAFANRNLGLGLNLDAAQWMGWGLVLVGLLLLGPALIWAYRRAAAPRQAGIGRLLAFRHFSVSRSVPSRLEPRDLPRNLRRIPIVAVDCDQTRFMDGTPDVAAALEEQEAAVEQVLQQRRGDPGLSVAYHGIAHIPFQFLVGHKLTTTVLPTLVELDQADGRWHAIQEGPGPDLGITSSEEACPGVPRDVIVRVSVSAEVDRHDAAAVVAEPFDEFHVRVRTPARDIVTHRAQVGTIANHFREALDKATRRLSAGGRIHVFAAVPMSVGFSLGRLVSANMHAEVIAYNFTAQASPRYAWGVRINVDAKPGRRLLKPRTPATTGPKDPGTP
ncbi:MAG: hypothetical protein DI532_12475 [Azospirillum brasilense]|nr:MAG: hypothetical protein DI532_12475 [Azospirillum brasilense]